MVPLRGDTDEAVSDSAGSCKDLRSSRSPCSRSALASFVSVSRSYLALAIPATKPTFGQALFGKVIVA